MYPQCLFLWKKWKKISVHFSCEKMCLISSCVIHLTWSGNVLASLYFCSWYMQQHSRKDVYFLSTHIRYLYPWRQMMKCTTYVFHWNAITCVHREIRENKKQQQSNIRIFSLRWLDTQKGRSLISESICLLSKKGLNFKEKNLLPLFPLRLSPFEKVFILPVKHSFLVEWSSFEKGVKNFHCGELSLRSVSFTSRYTVSWATSSSHSKVISPFYLFVFEVISCKFTEMFTAARQLNYPDKSDNSRLCTFRVIYLFYTPPYYNYGGWGGGEGGEGGGVESV